MDNTYVGNSPDSRVHWQTSILIQSVAILSSVLIIMCIGGMFNLDSIAATAVLLIAPVISLLDELCNCFNKFPYAMLMMMSSAYSWTRSLFCICLEGRRLPGSTAARLILSTMVNWNLDDFIEKGVLLYCYSCFLTHLIMVSFAARLEWVEVKSVKVLWSKLLQCPGRKML